MNQRVRCVIRGLLLAAAVLSGGCGLSNRGPSKINYYLLQPEFQSSETSFRGMPCVVIRPVASQTTYRELPLLYRTSDVEFETDYYNRFITTAPNQLTEAIRRWTDSLQWTVCPDESVGPRTEHYILRPVLETLYGDFRDRGNPAAVVELQLTLSHVASGRDGSTTILSKPYTARIPLDRRSPEALVEAQSRAVEDILGRFRADIADAMN